MLINIKCIKCYSFFFFQFHQLVLECCILNTGYIFQFLLDTSKPTTPAKASVRKQKPEACSSPLSKRNLALLRRDPLDLPPPTPDHKPTTQEPQHDDLVNHYLSREYCTTNNNHIFFIFFLRIRSFNNILI